MADNFSKLLIENIPHLRRYARSLTRDRHQSEDLVQDCLDRALSRMSQWQSDTNLRAWLFTIMHKPSRQRPAWQAPQQQLGIP